MPTGLAAYPLEVQLVLRQSPEEELVVAEVQRQVAPQAVGPCPDPGTTAGWPNPYTSQVEEQVHEAEDLELAYADPAQPLVLQVQSQRQPQRRLA